MKKVVLVFGMFWSYFGFAQNHTGKPIIAKEELDYSTDKAGRVMSLQQMGNAPYDMPADIYEQTIVIREDIKVTDKTGVTGKSKDCKWTWKTFPTDANSNATIPSYDPYTGQTTLKGNSKGHSPVLRKGTMLRFSNGYYKFGTSDKQYGFFARDNNAGVMVFVACPSAKKLNTIFHEINAMVGDGKGIMKSTRLLEDEEYEDY